MGWSLFLSLRHPNYFFRKTVFTISRAYACTHRVLWYADENQTTTVSVFFLNPYCASSVVKAGINALPKGIPSAPGA